MSFKRRRNQLESSPVSAAESSPLKRLNFSRNSGRNSLQSRNGPQSQTCNNNSEDQTVFSVLQSVEKEERELGLETVSRSTSSYHPNTSFNPSSPAHPGPSCKNNQDCFVTPTSSFLGIPSESVEFEQLPINFEHDPTDDWDEAYNSHARVDFDTNYSTPTKVNVAVAKEAQEDWDEYMHKLARTPESGLNEAATEGMASPSWVSIQSLHKKDSRDGSDDKWVRL